MGGVSIIDGRGNLSPDKVGSSSFGWKICLCEAYGRPTLSCPSDITIVKAYGESETPSTLCTPTTSSFVSPSGLGTREQSPDFTSGCGSRYHGIQIPDTKLRWVFCKKKERQLSSLFLSLRHLQINLNHLEFSIVVFIQNSLAGKQNIIVIAASIQRGTVCK